MKSSWRLLRVVIGAFVAFTIVMAGTKWLRPDQWFGLRATRPRVQFTGVPSTVKVRFLLDRIRLDPGDFVAQNMLASQLLQNLRETGNVDLLERARRASEASLASVPAERNPGGLANLARAEIAAHEFTEARDHALLLTQVDPGTAGSYSVLTDVLLELGDYAGAGVAIQKMRSLGSNSAETEIRVARLLFVQGDSGGARSHLFRALAFALNVSPPQRETVAWCHWQAGELEFNEGKYDAAEQHYRDALATFDGYVQALASLGRVRAARGEIGEAIQCYEDAVRRIPDPAYVATLGDLYHIAGRDRAADAKYALVETIGNLSMVNGARYNRQIALFYADHDRDASKAYLNAAQEYAVRRDIYGADALAWAALKAGRLSEARHASRAALRMSTRDPRILYHAGMIARASGDLSSAHAYLSRALALSPAFDPLQAIIARKALEN